METIMDVISALVEASAITLALLVALSATGLAGYCVWLMAHKGSK